MSRQRACSVFEGSGADVNIDEFIVALGDLSEDRPPVKWLFKDLRSCSVPKLRSIFPVSYVILRNTPHIPRNNPGRGLNISSCIHGVTALTYLLTNL